MSATTFETLSYDSKKPVCIFGCLLTERGKEIKHEMLSWLQTKYSVICINQEAPGDLFEFPALLCAREHSIRYNIPILYLHTKGAAHQTNVYEQSKVRNLWKHEFIDNYDYYQAKVLSDPYAVAAPFVSDAPLGITWLNGFIAGTSAWKNALVNPPTQPLGRLVYEFIFRNTEHHPCSRVLPHVNDIHSDAFEHMKRYINEEHFND
jgi:hypothetical protein